MSHVKVMVLAVVFVAACKGSDKAKQTADTSKTADSSKAARVAAQKYAFEGYPSWAAAHPDAACPARLEDLNEHVNAKDIKDPWGNPYKMFCGPTLPAGARGLAVVSLGPDGKEGTPDDIKSWE